jgi:hypothetical protein
MLTSHCNRCVRYEQQDVLSCDVAKGQESFAVLLPLSVMCRDARSRMSEDTYAVCAVYVTVYRICNRILLVYRDKMIEKRGKPLSNALHNSIATLVIT